MADQFNSRTITATSDGLTTGIVRKDDGVPGHVATLVSSNAAYIVSLPDSDDLPVGWKFEAYIGANGCEIQTASGTNDKINGTDADGTNEAAVPATTWVEILHSASGNFIMRLTDEGGDDIAGVTPD